MSKSTEIPLDLDQLNKSEVAILRAVLTLIVSIGYEKMSMDSIAETAKASKATIYRHWPGKAELTADAIRWHHNQKHVTPFCAGSHSETKSSKSHSNQGNINELLSSENGDIRSDLILLITHFSKTMIGEEASLIAAVLWAMRSDQKLRDLIISDTNSEKGKLTDIIIERSRSRGIDLDITIPNLIQEIVYSQIMMRLVVTQEPIDENYILHLVDEILMPVLVSRGYR